MMRMKYGISFFEVYIQVWKRALSIPDANIIKLWIRVIIKDLARKREYLR